MLVFTAFVAFVTAVVPITDTTCAAVAAVNALVPLPYARPVSVVTPVPPSDATTGEVKLNCVPVNVRPVPAV